MAPRIIDLDREAIKLSKEAIEMVQLDGGQYAAIVTAMLAIEARLAWLGNIISSR